LENGVNKLKVRSEKQAGDTDGLLL
jgi:hypothetical protein